MWLDELQDFLAGPEADVVLAGLLQLLTTPEVPPFVIVGTIWPESAHALTRSGMVTDTIPNRGAPGRLLELYKVIKWVDADEDFATADSEEIRSAAADDPRIREALEVNAGHAGSLTQVLAGGKLVLDRFLGRFSAEAPRFTPAAVAVLAAALDLRRLGYPNPVSSWAIAGAAVGYLQTSAFAQSSATWIHEGLGEAQEQVRGIRALAPWADVPAVIDGYVVHDYLLQHHMQVNRYRPIRETLWQTLASSCEQMPPETAGVLAEAAGDRGLATVELALLRRGRESRDPFRGMLAAGRYARLLAERAHAGDEAALTELQEHSYRDDQCAEAYCELLGHRAIEGHVSALSDLRQLAEESQRFAQKALARVLVTDAAKGDAEALDELRWRASMGDHAASDMLAVLLAKRAKGYDYDALNELRALAAHSPTLAEARLSFAQALAREARNGDEEALHELSALADRGEGYASLVFTGLLQSAAMSGTDGAYEELRRRADGGSFEANEALQSVLASRARQWLPTPPRENSLVLTIAAARGDLDALERLRERASGGESEALNGLIDALGTLAIEGDPSALADLRELAANDNDKAQSDLVHILEARVADIRDNEAREEPKRYVHAGYADASACLRRVYAGEDPGAVVLELRSDGGPILG